MKRFTAHEENWGEFVDIKMNAIELMQKKVKLAHKIDGTVLLGSVTDAYQPLERKYQITRGLLEKLLQTNLSVTILTKSDLVLRDIDLLKQFKKITVGITITTTDDQVSHILEPGATLAQKRLEALEVLSKHNIDTYAFVGPIIPGITDLPEIFNAVNGKVREIWGEAVNVKGGNFEDIKTCMEKNFKEIEPYFLEKVKDNAYWIDINKQFESLCEQYKIPLVGFYRH